MPRSYPFTFLDSIKVVLAPVFYQLEQGPVTHGHSLSTALQSPELWTSSAHSHIPLILTHNLSRRKRKQPIPTFSLGCQDSKFPSYSGPLCHPSRDWEGDMKVSFFVIHYDNCKWHLKNAICSTQCQALCTDGTQIWLWDVTYFIPRSS